jgi:hypothetical protein
MALSRWPLASVLPDRLADCAIIEHESQVLAKMFR